MSRKCTECHSGEKVQGYGNRISPPIVFVGESPGENEVREGRPFSPRGKSGQLLHQIMKDLDVDIKTLYFTNVCMCPCRGAPPADKVHMCYDGLMDELEALKPKLIVPMGNVAAKAVGQYEKGISFVRGSYRKL